MPPTKIESPRPESHGQSGGPADQGAPRAGGETAPPGLARGAQQLQSFFAAATAGLSIVDRQYRYVQISETLAAINGRPVREHLGKTVREVIPQLAPMLEPIFAEVLATGKTVVMETSGETPAQPGELRHWSVSYFPIGSEAGRPEGVGVIVVEITKHKRTERALRESQTLLRGILDHSPELMFVKDTGGRYLLINRQFEARFGVTSDQVLGKRDDEIFPAAQAAAFQANDAQVLAAGAPLAFEETARYTDTAHSSIVSKFPLRSADGRIFAIGGIVTDITKRKEAEDNLSHKHRQLLEAQELGHIGNWEWDLATNAVTCSDEFFRIFGYQPQQITFVAEMFMEHVHPEDRALVRGIAQKALADHAPFSFEYRFRRRDGTTGVQFARGAVHLDERGAPARIAGVAQDITEIRHAEMELWASEQRLATLFRRSPVAIGYDELLEGRLREINDQYARLFGYEREEMIGRTVGQLKLWVNPRERDAVVKLLQTHGRVEGMEARFRRKSGECFDALVSMEILPLADEPMLVTMLLDVTERKKAENELRQSREQLRALAARLQSVREEEGKRIARELHDELGQQLTALQMDLDNLEVRLPKPGSALAAQCRRMQAVLEHTIGAVQRISGELRLGHLEELGLSAAIEWQLSEFSKRTGIRCVAQRVQEVGGCDMASATTFFRIFQEALTNIARHAQATAVEVALLPDGDHLILEVRDNGRGITSRRDVDRKALGLLGMRERAQALRGEVKVASAVGMGTIVRARLPLRAPAPMPP